MKHFKKPSELPDHVKIRIGPPFNIERIVPRDSAVRLEVCSVGGLQLRDMILSTSKRGIQLSTTNPYAKNTKST